MSARTRFILFAGGVFHSILVLQGWIGVFTVVVAVRSRYWEIEREALGPGLWMMALLLVAIGFGWYCLKLVGAVNPWRAELSALAATTALVGGIGTVGAFVGYAIRTDYAAATFLNAFSLLAAILAGTIGFFLIGRRQRLTRSGIRASHEAATER